MKIEYLDETDSTNEYIKRYLSSGEDRIVVAKRQTGGRGTKGRSFLSGEGGVYLSALNFYSDFPAKDAFLIMTHAAVAVCRTAEEFGLFPEIKWPNDVFLCGRKCCGILVENELNGCFVKSSIVGIGVNVSNDLSGIEEVAVSLSEAKGEAVSCDRARDYLIKYLQKADSFGDYLSRVRFLGREVAVTESGGKTYSAKAVGISSDGRLMIEREGKNVCLSAAEISLKI